LVLAYFWATLYMHVCTCVTKAPLRRQYSAFVALYKYNVLLPLPYRLMHLSFHSARPV